MNSKYLQKYYLKQDLNKRGTQPLSDIENIIFLIPLKFWIVQTDVCYCQWSPSVSWQPDSNYNLKFLSTSFERQSVIHRPQGHCGYASSSSTIFLHSHRKKEAVISQQKQSSSFWLHGFSSPDWQNRTKGQ